MKNHAALVTGPRQIEFRCLEVPDIREGEALLRIEGCGICGSDISVYNGASHGITAYPVIPGHEFVGRIERISDEAAATWDVAVGDRVAVECFVTCGVCEPCRMGRHMYCRSQAIYGFAPCADGCRVWGGYSEYVILHPKSVMHKVPDHLSVEDAVLFNPIGGGFEWGVKATGSKAGETVLVIGPGQRGLACVLANAEIGAGRIIVAGRGRSRWKFDIARDFGATDFIDTETENVPQAVRDITGGAMADRVVDVSARSTQSIVDAIDAVRPEGTVVLAGAKHASNVPGLDPDKILMKSVTVRGVLGVGYWANKQAIRTVASGRYDFSRYHTHTIPISEADRAIQTLAGETPGEEALHITLTPP